MNKADKPTTAGETQKLATKRPSGEREGWVFHHVALMIFHHVARYSIIGFASCSPDRTEVRNDTQDHFHLARPHRTSEENPMLHIESLREAISEAYHAKWSQYSTARNQDQKDKDVGAKMSRSRKH